MEDHVYKLTEIVGTSHRGMDAAVQAAVERARDTLRHVRWFEVTGTRGFIEEDGGIQYQATVKIGFGLDDLV